METHTETTAQTENLHFRTRRLFLEQLRSKFIRRKRLLTKPQLICEARSFWNTLGIDQRISGDTKFSPHWATNFMKRNGLSLRKTRLAKRPGNANTEIVKHFRETLSVCISHYGPENVLNFDETSWRLVGPFIHGTGQLILRQNISWILHLSRMQSDLLLTNVRWMWTIYLQMHIRRQKRGCGPGQAWRIALIDRKQRDQIK